MNINSEHVPSNVLRFFPLDDLEDVTKKKYNYIYKYMQYLIKIFNYSVF